MGPGRGRDVQLSSAASAVAQLALFKRVCSSSAKRAGLGTWAAEMWASAATSATTTLATRSIGFGNRRRRQHIGIRNIGDRNLGIGNRQLEYRHRHHRQRTNRLQQACQPRRLGGGQRRQGNTALVMGGTDFAAPSASYSKYAARFVTPCTSRIPLRSWKRHRQFFPFTGLNRPGSVAQSNESAHRDHGATRGGKRSRRLRHLPKAPDSHLRNALSAIPALPASGLDELSLYTLTSLVAGPDGGILTFGLQLPPVGSHCPARRADTYPTVDYAFQYDGVSGFPKYR